MDARERKGREDEGDSQRRGLVAAQILAQAFNTPLFSLLLYLGVLGVLGG